MESKRKRKSASRAKSSYCHETKRSKISDEVLEGYSDIDEEYLDSVFEATRNVKRKASICSFSIKTKELGVAAVDVKEFSDISYAACSSPEIYVLSCGSMCVEEEEDHKPRKRRVKTKESVERLQEFKEVKILKHPADVTAMSYTNENLLLSCSLEGTVRAWDHNYELVQSYRDTMKSLSDIHANSKMAYFVTSSLTGMRSIKGDVLYGASLFSLSRNDPIMCLLGHTAPTQSARFHANGMYVATACQDGSVKMWSTQTSANAVRTFQDMNPEHGHRKMIAFSPDGKYLASTQYGSVHVWDIASGRLVQTLGSASPSQAVCHICYSQSGEQLAVGGTDGELKIWNLKDTGTGSLDADLSDYHVVGMPIHRIGCTDNIFSCVCSETF